MLPHDANREANSPSTLKRELALAVLDENFIRKLLKAGHSPSRHINAPRDYPMDRILKAIKIESFETRLETKPKSLQQASSVFASEKDCIENLIPALTQHVDEIVDWMQNQKNEWQLEFDQSTNHDINGYGFGFITTKRIPAIYEYTSKTCHVIMRKNRKQNWDAKSMRNRRHSDSDNVSPYHRRRDNQDEHDRPSSHGRTDPNLQNGKRRHTDLVRPHYLQSQVCGHTDQAKHPENPDER